MANFVGEKNNFANFQVRLGQNSPSRINFNKLHIGSHLVKKILLKYSVFGTVLIVSREDFHRRYHVMSSTWCS